MRPIALSLPLAVATLAACATGFPAERGEELEQRVKRVERTSASAQLQDDRAAAAQREQALEARVAELQRKVDALAAAPRGTATAGPQVAELGRELQSQRAALEAQTRRLDAIEQTLARVEADGRRRVAARAAPVTPPHPAARASGDASAPPNPASPPASPAAPAPSPAPGPTAAPDATPGEKGEYLALAHAQEAKGDRAAARDMYAQYVKSHPDDPSAAEAWYRLGELAFEDHRYPDAVASYGEVAKTFPRSRLAPDALLRTAESMLAMQLRDDATVLLKEVPKRYPGTPAASRAQRRLAELGGTRQR